MHMKVCLRVMQVSRLQRELERMEAERNRAREDARRYSTVLSCQNMQVNKQTHAHLLHPGMC